MEITTKSGKIEKQGVCLCEDKVDSAVGSQRERRQCLTACSELQSDWVRAVGERGLQYCSVERGPESLGRRNTLNANVGPGGGAAISRHPEARGACTCMGNRTREWYIVHVLVACTVDSHSGGGCILAMHPCQLEQGSSVTNLVRKTGCKVHTPPDQCGLPGTVLCARRATGLQAFAARRISIPGER